MIPSYGNGIKNTSKSLQRTMREREVMVWPSTQVIQFTHPVTGVVSPVVVKDRGTYVKEVL